MPVATLRETIFQFPTFAELVKAGVGELEVAILDRTRTQIRKFKRISDEDLDKAERIGIPIAFIILIVVFSQVKAFYGYRFNLWPTLVKMPQSAPAGERERPVDLRHDLGHLPRRGAGVELGGCNEERPLGWPGQNE